MTNFRHFTSGPGKAGMQPLQARQLEPKGRSKFNDAGKCRGNLSNGDRCTNDVPKAKPGEPQRSLCDDCQGRNLGEHSGTMVSGQGRIF